MAPGDLPERWGLYSPHYQVYTSRLDPKKADPKYYEQMLKHFNLDIDDVIYFEHDPAAVKSAASVGIKSYLYDGVKKDLESLKAFLDANL